MTCVAPRAFYNENDPKAAAWLRELIKEGRILEGEVDERSIIDVVPSDLQGFTQCHFFAGIGGWSYALELAAWPADRPVWTGSCPCQPFSAAGKGQGFADERHLWPAWFHLIEQCRPAILFGEQVASKDGLAWFDLVSSDLEAESYAVGACDLGAASVGAPHIRQRLYFVADSGGQRCEGLGLQLQPGQSQLDHTEARWCGEVGGLADHEAIGQGKERALARGQLAGELAQGRTAGSELGGGARELGDAVRGRRERRQATDCRDLNDRTAPERQQDQHGSRFAGTHWSDAEFIPCSDGKARPIEPGVEPLAHGTAGRVGLLRGYGNAIVPQVAQVFIEAYLEGESHDRD